MTSTLFVIELTLATEVHPRASPGFKAGPKKILIGRCSSDLPPGCR